MPPAGQAGANPCIVPLYEGTMGYEAAYREPDATGAAPPALVPQLVLIIVDGMRYDLSEQMPCLEGLRAEGAWGKSISSFPSFSQPSPKIGIDLSSIFITQRSCNGR